MRGIQVQSDFENKNHFGNSFDKRASAPSRARIRSNDAYILCANYWCRIHFIWTYFTLVASQLLCVLALAPSRSRSFATIARAVTVWNVVSFHFGVCMSLNVCINIYSICFFFSHEFCVARFHIKGIFVSFWLARIKWHTHYIFHWSILRVTYAFTRALLYNIRDSNCNRSSLYMRAHCRSSVFLELSVSVHLFSFRFIYLFLFIYLFISYVFCIACLCDVLGILWPL